MATASTKSTISASTKTDGVLSVTASGCLLIKAATDIYVESQNVSRVPSQIDTGVAIKVPKDYYVKVLPVTYQVIVLPAPPITADSVSAEGWHEVIIGVSNVIRGNVVIPKGTPLVQLEAAKIEPTLFKVEVSK